MKKIFFALYLIVLLWVIFFISGCCMLAGFGMENAKKEAKERNDNWHKTVCDGFDRFAK